MTTKLEILGPYTPEHEGPFCTRDGKSVRLITKTEGASGFPIVGFINNEKHPAIWFRDGRAYLSPGPSFEHESDLMNAREVPVAREFWVNEYETYNGKGTWISVFDKEHTASINKTDSYIRTIHVREVLPGEGV